MEWEPIVLSMLQHCAETCHFLMDLEEKLPLCFSFFLALYRKPPFYRDFSELGQLRFTLVLKLKVAFSVRILSVLTINSGSLGGSTESEPTQMKMFNFLWLIWDHYLPLTPTRNDWHPWHPQHPCKFTQKANLLSKTMNTKVPLPQIFFSIFLKILKNWFEKKILYDKLKN